MKIDKLSNKFKTGLVVCVLSILAYWYFNNGINVDSHDAIQLSHALPDGSQVILNSNSELNYDDSYKDERKVHLDGEAYFELENGETFIVDTDLGKINLFRGSFNVSVRGDILTVACRTGKLHVLIEGMNTTILTSGKRLRYEKDSGNNVDIVDPMKINSWTTGESYFDRTPLVDVVTALGMKYNTDITLPKKYKSDLYTGSFIHHDIEEALETVLSPMKINYKVLDHKVIIE